jgi:hypothetical protein
VIRFFTIGQGIKPPSSGKDVASQREGKLLSGILGLNKEIVFFVLIGKLNSEVSYE